MQDEFAVVGGVYLEICEFPLWNRVFGSAGRAASLISEHYPVSLYSATSDRFKQRLEYNFSESQHPVDFYIESIPEGITFEYFHALGSPTHYPILEPDSKELKVEAENILLFGALEFKSIIQCKRLVYDPQNTHPDPYNQNGSQADEVVYVLNHIQARNMGECESLDQAAEKILQGENVVAVIIKRGVHGADLYVKGSRDPIQVPCYPTDSVFKIGSGDIFSAAFAMQWIKLNKSFEDAAVLASKFTAIYVDTKSTSIHTKDIDSLSSKSLPFYTSEDDLANLKKVYLAGPFFNISERMLLEDIVRFFEKERIPYFSPFHHVGVGKDISLGHKDLIGIDESRCILGLMDHYDPGTMAEIGYARSKKINAHCFFSKIDPDHQMMFRALNCHIYDDLSSAIYNSAWDR